MSTHTAHDSSKYYVPHSSPWPIFGSVSLFVLMIGAVSFMNEWAGGWIFLRNPALATMVAAAFTEKPHGRGYRR